MFKRLHLTMAGTLSAVNTALAQAAPPAGTGAPASPAVDAESSLTWLWVIIALVIIAAIVWYFMRGRSRTTTAGTTSTSSVSPGDRPHVYDDKTRR